MMAAVCASALLMSPVLLEEDFAGLRTYCGIPLQPRTGTVFLDPLERPRAEAEAEPFAIVESSTVSSLVSVHRFGDVCDAALAGRYVSVLIAIAIALLGSPRSRSRRAIVGALGLLALVMAIWDGPPLLLFGVVAGALLGLRGDDRVEVEGQRQPGGIRT